MENKKFKMLNINKKVQTTHIDLQKDKRVKKGGRPKKSAQEKLNSIVSLNVNQYEKEILESEAASMGLSIVALIRMCIANALKQDFKSISINSISTNKKQKNGKVIKQYAICVTKDVKKELENKAKEYMISVSELLKIALRINGYNI